jgi:hypothetical protein
MTFDTKRAAQASLREFSPWMRANHTIVRFWSEERQAWRYCRVFVPKKGMA